jgi:hypothetical protein
MQIALFATAVTQDLISGRHGDTAAYANTAINTRNLHH